MRRLGLLSLCLLLSGLAAAMTAGPLQAAAPRVSGARVVSSFHGDRELCRHHRSTRRNRAARRNQSARRCQTSGRGAGESADDSPTGKPTTPLPPLPELIAPETACPGQTDETLTVEAQEATMECMINFVRAAAGLSSLAGVPSLESSSADKATDIIACNEFSHTACGREFTYWFEQDGYGQPGGCWGAGENIAWGTGELGTVRSILTAWVNSPEHLENMLESSYDEFGVGLEVGSLKGYSGAHVWVTHFAERC
jgi:uncharacterized protein YkwD